MGFAKTKFLLQIQDKLDSLLRQGKRIMATLTDIQARLTQLETEVSEQTTVNQSAITLLNGLSAIIAALREDLAEAQAGGDPAAVQAVLDRMAALQAQIDNDTTKLATALQANTPTE